jgi:hypothetical protein
MGSTLTGPRKQRKNRARAQTALELAASVSTRGEDDDAAEERSSGGVYAAVAKAQAAGKDLPASLPEIWDPGIRFLQDVNGCHHAALRTEFFLVKLCARYGIPLQSVAGAIELLTLFVEVSLLDRLAHADLYSDGLPDEEQYDWNEGHALQAGLTIRRRQKGKKRKKCLLPDCRGELITGVKCPNMRPIGDRFCPDCANVYITIMRARECGRELSVEEAVVLCEAGA